MGFTKLDGFFEAAEHFQCVAQVTARLGLTQDIALNSSKSRLALIREL